MRKFFYAVTFVLIVTFAISARDCAAKDIWVDRWDITDIYVMDDTITSSTSDTRKSFSVSIKYVENGKLKKVVTQDYGKYESNMWQEHVNDHWTAIHPVDKIFEFCMKQLGWSYRIEASDPIIKFYY